MAIAGYKSSFLITSPPSINVIGAVMANPSNDAQTFAPWVALYRYWDKTQPTTLKVELDDVQSLTITGSPTGGTWDIIFGGDTSAPLAIGATAAQVQTALQNMPSIGAGNVLVTGAAGGPWQIEFTGTLGFSPQVNVTSTNSFTGGVTPTVVVGDVQTGQALGVYVGSFTVRMVGGIVVLTSPLAGANFVVKATVNYFPVATLGEAASCEFSGKVAMLEADVFQGIGGNGAKVFVPGLLNGTMKTSTWWLNHTRCQSLLNRDLIVVSFTTPTGNRYEGFCYASDCNIKASVKSLVGQDLVFELTDQFFAN